MLRGELGGAEMGDEKIYEKKKYFCFKGSAPRLYIYNRGTGLKICRHTGDMERGALGAVRGALGQREANRPLRFSVLGNSRFLGEVAAILGFFPNDFWKNTDPFYRPCERKRYF